MEREAISTVLGLVASRVSNRWVVVMVGFPQCLVARLLLLLPATPMKGYLPHEEPIPLVVLVLVVSVQSVHEEGTGRSELVLVCSWVMVSWQKRSVLPMRATRNHHGYCVR